MAQHSKGPHLQWFSLDCTGVRCLSPAKIPGMLFKDIFGTLQVFEVWTTTAHASKLLFIFSMTRHPSLETFVPTNGNTFSETDHEAASTGPPGRPSMLRSETERHLVPVILHHDNAGAYERSTVPPLLLGICHSLKDARELFVHWGSSRCKPYK